MAAIYESRESSSPMITRAVAAGLSQQPFIGYEFPALQRLALRALGVLPQGIGRWLIPRVQGSSALDDDVVANVRTDVLVKGRLEDYANLEGRYPAVVLGVGMGGATAHLSLALNAPFLPQAFVMTLKNGSVDGNVHRYVNLSKDLARKITYANPELMSIQHYDPIHDGWLVRSVNHLRLKLTGLPEGYKQFIRSKLNPSGEVIYLEGQANWLRYRLGEKNVFQVGGWGDISAEEFLNGSERIKRYCAQERLTQTDWRLEEYPLEEGRESEWGSEAGLKESLQSFCEQEGYRFVCISFDDPNDFSRLAFTALDKQFKMNGVDPSGTIIEMFSQYDPAAPMRYGLLPIWLIFNTNDSLRYLKTMRDAFLPGKPILFSALSTFSLTPDMVKWRDWQDCFEGFEVLNIGARSTHYPADTLALVQWQELLHKWGEKHVTSPLKPIDGQMLKKAASELTSGSQTE